MHELSLALELHRGVRAEVDALGGGRLVRVTVAVGSLSGVEPELLRHAWEAVVADGPDRDAALELEWRVATQRCAPCGLVEEAHGDAWLRRCPRCGAPLVVAGGRELDVTSLAYDELPAIQPSPC
ncbi:MAG: hydrogenase maturation nickel metallochaperone HypA [Planctomycetes bacterium]|nr:hydrogenase maturation nickel metallochaperone HypA [Planctomycetota bacterium]